MKKVVWIVFLVAVVMGVRPVPSKVITVTVSGIDRVKGSIVVSE